MKKISIKKSEKAFNKINKLFNSAPSTKLTRNKVHTNKGKLDCSCLDNDL